MLKKVQIELISAILLILLGIVVVILPIFSVSKINLVILVSFIIYGLIQLIKNILILKEKEYSGFAKFLVALLLVALLLFWLDVQDSPWNLALILFLFVFLISFVKLKVSDYYHDRKNPLWLLNIVNLVLFIIVGLISALNLSYTGDIQILVIGFFFIINGILELMNPLVSYLVEKK